MANVNISSEDKAWFDSFKEEGETQAEAFERMRRQTEAYNGKPVDTEALAEELIMALGNDVQNAAYRGAKDGVQGCEITINGKRLVETYSGP